MWLCENEHTRAALGSNTGRELGYGQTPHSKRVEHISAHKGAARGWVSPKIYKYLHLLVQFQELVLLDHFMQIFSNIFNQLPQIDIVIKNKSILLVKKE